MGDFVQAQLVKEFVDEELVPGHLPSNINFDEAFTEWKNEIRRNNLQTTERG